MSVTNGSNLLHGSGLVNGDESLGTRQDGLVFAHDGTDWVSDGVWEGVAHHRPRPSSNRAEWTRVGGVPITEADLTAQLRTGLGYDQAQLRAAEQNYRQAGGLVGHWEHHRGRR